MMKHKPDLDCVQKTMSPGLITREQGLDSGEGLNLSHMISPCL